MGYENSKACQMLATHCACCGKELVDAASVELGLGPVCRRKYWSLKEIPEENRVLANKIVYSIAAQLGEKPSDALCQMVFLRELGFDKLVDRIEKRVIKVRVDKDGDVYIVRAPYREEAIPSWREVGRWQRDDKTYRVPLENRRGLWSLLRAFYPGELAKSDDYFKVPGGA